jgi:type IV pilus assembly protein PilB
MTPAAATHARRRLVGTRIGTILVEQGVVTPEQLDEALARQQERNDLLGQVLLAMELDMDKEVLGEGIAASLATQYGFPRVPLEAYDIDAEVLSLVPKRIAQRHRLIPVERAGCNLTVAMVNPLDAAAVRRLENLSGCIIHPVVSTPFEISRAIARHYS